MSQSPLHRLLLINGGALALQGAADMALGPWLHVGEQLTAGGDSDARFLGGLLIGIGVFWIALSRRATLPLPAIQVLAGGMMLGVAGRAVSLLVTGTASPLMLAVMAIESATTALVLAVATRATHAATTSPVVA